MLRRMGERNAYCQIEWMASISDKAAGARSIQGMASMGRYFLPKMRRGKVIFLLNCCDSLLANA